jgi:vacuolar-type H+-ATPase subunit C/Vma6
MQLHNLKGSPQQLFDKDLLHQCKLWHKSGERVILLMDANEHVLKGKFNKALTRNGLDMEEFTNSSIPIDCGYKSSEIEVLNLFWIAQAITKHLS